MYFQHFTRVGKYSEALATQIIQRRLSLSTLVPITQVRCAPLLLPIRSNQIIFRRGQFTLILQRLHQCRHNHLDWLKNTVRRDSEGNLFYCRQLRACAK
jgi:hypothetical protein